MARKVYGALDISDNELLNALLQNLPSDPSGLAGKVYYNSATKEIRYHDGTAWRILGLAGTGGPPTGNAGGDLSGTYPNPQIAAGVIVDADVAAANKDGAAATPSLRTLGAGAQQAAPGNDSRFTDSRPPSGTASGDLSGTYPSPQIAAGVIVDADVNGSANIAQAKIASLTTDLAARLLKAGGTMTGPLVLAADPTAPTEAATKQYVDLVGQGFNFKASCRVCTWSSNVALTGLQTIDGQTLIAGDRVLAIAQSNATENGIYVAASGAWTRAADMNSAGELTDGTLVPVAAGNWWADSLWMCISISASTWFPGTHNSSWTKFASVSDLIAGAGLTKAGNQIDVVGDANLSVAADLISVLSAPKWTTPRAITLGGDLTGNVSIDGSAPVTLTATLAPGAGGKRYAAALTASTSQVVTHNLNTQDVVVSVYATGTPFAEVDVEVEHTSANTITVKANPALPAGMRVVVLG